MQKPQITLQRAAAEFAIIVLGVLTAFAVDNWNQSRAEAALESQYLVRLLAEVTNDVEILELTLRLAEEKNNALRVVRNWRAETDEPKPLIDALRAPADNLGFSLPSLNTATFDDLTSTGRLSLIDTDLRQALLVYYRSMSSERERTERRMTPFPGYLYSILEPGLRIQDDAEYLEWLDRCEEACQIMLNAAGTDEFRRLVKAEANYGQAVEDLISPAIEQARQLQSQLEMAVSK